MKQKSHNNIRRVLITALAVLLVSVLCVVGFAANGSPEPAPEAQECYTLGDINSDGSITSDDAIYLLYNRFWSEDYPIHGVGDLNGDQVPDADDALDLLYAVLFPDVEDLQLPGLTDVIHSYGDPLLIWNETENGYSAKCVTDCACHKAPVTEDAVVYPDVQNPSCMEMGKTTWTATVEGEVLETKTETLPAPGHKWTAADCDTPRHCENCGDEEGDVLGHRWETTTISATCQSEGQEIHTCSVCGEIQTSTLALDENGHVLDSGTTTDNLVDGQPCTYQTVVTYECTVDGCTFEKQVSIEQPYEKHVFENAELTKPATCTEEGERTFTCKVAGCGATKTETVPVNEDAHNWGAAASAEEVTIYTCGNGCGETKTTVVVVSNEAVSKEKLADNELQLTSTNEETGETVTTAALSVDEATLNALDDDKEVKVSVEEAPQEAIEALPEEQKAQLGDNPVVYDFNMVYVDGEGNEGDQISEFAGEVTITLPYELEAGEDPENIAVWFIPDNGDEIKAIKATYSDGYVTFKTTHFSYYTVTRLTPAERCATYGHLELVKKEKAVTCTEDGYYVETCPRCGENVVDEHYTRTGHQYVTDRHDATCDEGGDITKTCSACDHQISVTLPAMGHNMQKDESVSKEPTCTEAGTLVYSCTNGCGRTMTEDLPATGHDFELTAEEKADCTNNGHKDYKCKNGCGEKFSEVTEGFTGHLYNEENAVWDWDEDENGNITNVTCVLRCAYNLENEKHWHELKKITVTSRSEGVTCTEDGKIKYTFQANYNAKTTFTKEIEVDVPALGHIPSTEWQHDDFLHFKKCARCSEEVKREAHIMIDDETITEATCVDKGEMSTVCVECGYEDTRELPATNVHDYDQHGICRDCGKSETDCKHFRVIEEEIDLSEYNVCEGTRAIWLSCECGYDRELKVWSDGCSWEFTTATMTIDGVSRGGELRTCVNCGLEVYDFGYLVHDEESCRTNSVHYRKAVINGTVLGESHAADERFFSTEHYTTKNRTVHLTMEEDGICDVTYDVYSCGCGEYAYHEWAGGGCDWEIIDYTAEGELCRCRICGAERLETVGQTTRNGCTEVFTYTTIISQNDEEVYRFTYNRKGSNHLYRMVNAEAYNNYWVVDAQCVFCGFEDRIVQDGCDENCMYATEYTLVDSLCCAAIVQQTCPCGEHGVELTEWNIVDFSCFWQVNETGTVFTCANCGARKEVSTQLQETDNPCIMEARTDYTFYDANGNEVAAGYSISENDNHNYVTEYTLMGDSCDDGVLVTNTCNGCGDQETSTYSEHWMYIDNTYDLSHLDMCNDWATLESCVCGIFVHFNFTSIEGNYCEWNWVDVEGTDDAWLCGKCGVVYVFSNENIGMKDPCHQIQQYTYTLYDGIGGEELWSVTYEQVNEVHDEYFDFELMEGATTCNDGYHVYSYCFNCDHEEYWGEWNGCDSRLVKRETFPVEGMCATPVLETYSCACGANGFYITEWIGEECYVSYMEYNDATGRDEGTCENCGVLHTYRYRVEDNEEDPCFYFEIREYTYERDGQVLVDIPLRTAMEQHSYSTEITMMGETCDDGYLAEHVCQFCDDAYTSYHEGCTNTTVLETEVLYDQVGICGKVQIITEGCACKISQSALDWRCNTRHNYEAEDGYYMGICEDCGLERHYKNEDIYIPGSCLYDHVESYIFYQNGQKVAEKAFTNQYASHERVYAFDMYGTTCEEGYLVTSKCYYCGYEDSWEDYACSTYITDFKLLADSDVSCGQFYYIRYATPCGKVDYWSYGPACNFEHIGLEDDWNIYQCRECGIVWKERVTEERSSNTCQHTNVREIEILKDGEVICSEVIRERYVEHINVVDEFYMNGEACADGYTVTGNCLFCHEPVIDENVYYDCQWFPTEVHLLSDEEGTCGLNAYIDGNCACGNSPFTLPGFNCRFQEIESNEDGTVVYMACNVCGLEAVQEKLEDTVDGCVTTQHYRYTMSKDGQVINEIVVSFETVSHEYIYELEAFGNSCSDGYLATGTCRHCGNETAPIKGYGCTRYLVDYYEFEHEGSCGTYTIKAENCACGNNGSSFSLTEDLPCEMEMVHSESTATSAIYYLQCAKCGRQLNVSGTLGVMDDACSIGIQYDCQWIWNGEPAGEFEIDGVALKDHKLIYYEFEMLGDSIFVDGCDLYARCAECGLDMGCVGTTYSYGYYPVAYESLSDNLLACGNRRFGYYEYAYPDGKPAGPMLTSNCNFNSITTTPGGTTIQQCNACGLQWVGAIVEERIPGTCTFVVTVDAAYGFNYADGSGFEVEMGAGQETFESVRHQPIYSFDMHGDSCEDGYEVYAECAFCDIRMKLSGEFNEHLDFSTAVYDLLEKGVCAYSDGTAWAIQYNCPCMKIARVDTGWGCNLKDISNDMVQVDDRTFIHTATASCANEGCTTTKHTQQVVITQPVEGDCLTSMKMTYTMTFADGSTMEVYGNDETFNHIGETIREYELVEGATTCEDGVVETQTCSNCLEVIGSVQRYHCQVHQVSQSDMSDYGVACGGYLIHSECPCGNLYYYELVENNCNMNSVEIDPVVSDLVQNGHYQTEDGEILVQNYAYEMICTNSDCGIRARSCNYWVKEGCELVNYEILQLGYDEATGEYLEAFTNRLNSHDYHDPASQVTTRELGDGAELCTDGVHIQTYCRDCDEMFVDGWYHYCETYPTEMIDLGQYDSLCGGYLAKYECLCGNTIPYYDFLDLKCDLDQVETEHFVEGTLDEVGQNTTNGWAWLDSESWILTCAVTDPEICGMKIRQSRCFLQEGCYAVEYYVFQLDYDPDTDTWAKEIRFPTGGRHTYHPVEEYSRTETISDTEQVYISGYDCALCGSSYTNKSYGLHVDTDDGYYYCNPKNETIAVNKLDNGEAKRYYDRSEYISHNGYDVYTLGRVEKTYADGEEYWHQYEYEYDFSGECKRTETYTDSFGTHTVTPQEGHLTSQTSYADPAPTCGRFGQAVWKNTCVFCGKVTDEWYDILEPYGHFWVWNEEYGIYECGDCMLECVNDASGSIVLEDLSEELGNGTDYVVAYWNRGNIQYQQYICVVMNDLEGDNERFLTVNVSDDPLDEYGSKAIRFSIAEAEAAAAQIVAQEGYTGDYSIRLTFAPTDITGELDYSVTFDTLKAE